MPELGAQRKDAAAKVLRQLDVLDALFGGIRDVVAGDEVDRGRRLIGYRRQLTEALSAIDRTGTAAFGGGSRSDEFRRRLRDLRHRIAIHQAEWSAIEIGSDDYRQSAQSVLSEYRTFEHWLRGAASALDG